MSKSRISDFRYYSDQTPDVDYYTNDNLLGSCCSELAIFFICFILIGPLISIIGIIWLLSGIVRGIYYLYRLVFMKTKSTEGEIGMSLTFEEARWLSEMSASMIGVLFMDKPVELSELKRVISERIGNLDSSSNKNYQITKRLRQTAQKIDFHWRWVEECEFDLCHHVTLLTPKFTELSDILVEISNKPYDFSHPFWNLYLINSPISSNQGKSCSSTIKINEKKCKLCESNSTIVLKIHPSITDGMCIMKLLSEIFNDMPEPSQLGINNYRKKFCFKAFTALFYSFYIFIKSWSFRQAQYRLFDSSDYKSPSEIPSQLEINSHQFVFCHFSLEEITRLKLITRSTFGEIALSLLSSGIKHHHHIITKSVNIKDYPCFITVDMSSNSQRKCGIQKIKNDLTYFDIELPLSTEGMIPILWKLKQKMKTLKSSSDYLFFYLLPKFISILFSTSLSKRFMRSYYRKSKVLLSSLNGTWQPILINENKANNLLFWFPLFELISVSMCCFSYNDQFTICIRGQNSKCLNLQLLVDAIKYQVAQLSKLLENRKVPGEKSNSINLKNIKFGVDQSFPTSSLTDNQILNLLNDIQINMQNEKNHSIEEIEEMKLNFSVLFSALKEKKKNIGKFIEFEEDIENSSNSVNRRFSLPAMTKVLQKNSSKRFSFSKQQIKITDNNENKSINQMEICKTRKFPHV